MINQGNVIENKEVKALLKEKRVVEGWIEIFRWLLEENFKDREFDETPETIAFRDDTTEYLDWKITYLLKEITLIEQKIRDIFMKEFNNKNTFISKIKIGKNSLWESLQ